MVQPITGVAEDHSDAAALLRTSLIELCQLSREGNTLLVKFETVYRRRISSGAKWRTKIELRVVPPVLGMCKN